MLTPAIVLCAEDNFATQTKSRRHGLAARKVDVLRDLITPGPADDVWILPRDPSSVSTPPDAILCPPGCAQLDAGVALALVVGRDATLAGVTVAIDIVRRDVPPSQAYLARSWPTHTPLGAHVVPVDEVGDLGALTMSFSVNGVERQRASTADMVATPAQLLDAIAARITLHAGDVIVTGSPPGTAFDTGDGWLQAGDRVVAEIEGVGRLEMAVAATSDN